MAYRRVLTWLALSVLALQQVGVLPPLPARPAHPAPTQVTPPRTAQPRTHPQRFTGLPAHHVVWLRQPQPSLPRRYVPRAVPRRHLGVRVALRPRPAAWRAQGPHGRPTPLRPPPAPTLSLPPIRPQRVVNGRYRGTICGLTAKALYLWVGSRMLALHLTPTSRLTLEGRRVRVWTLGAGDQATVTVRAGVVTRLSDLSPTLPPAVARIVRGSGVRPRPRAAGLGPRLRPALSQQAPSSDIWTPTGGLPITVYGLAFDPLNSGTLWVGS